MNDANAAELSRVLASAYCFAELDVRITECIELAEDCNQVGVDLSELAAPLDATVRADDAETAEPHMKRQRSCSDVADALPGERPAVLDVTGFDAKTASALLTCAGRYCAVINQPGLALGHFRAALIAASASAGHSPLAPPAVGPSAAPEPAGSSAAEAHLGMVQAALTLGQRPHAASLALSFWRSGAAVGAAMCSRAHLHLAFLLAALSDALPAPPPDALGLLRRLTPLLQTPACSAVEGLAARWLPSQVPAAVVGGGEHSLLYEPFVQAALAGSRTFGSMALEPLVCAARRQLLFLLLRHTEADPVADGLELGGGGAPGLAVEPSASLDGSARLQRIEAAAAVASWTNFADFCLEETAPEAAAVTRACGAIEAGLSAGATDWPLSHPDQLAFLAAAAMYQDLSKLRAVELWLRDADFAAEVGRRLQAAGLTRTWAMLQEHVLLPYARHRRAERLAVLTPIHSLAVRSFYDATIYPKWHVAEVFGIASAPSIGERLRRQYRHFAWPHGEDPHGHRMLIAGSGSGHQVAQALLSYEHIGITAVDISPVSPAFLSASSPATRPPLWSRRPTLPQLTARLVERAHVGDARLFAPEAARELARGDGTPRALCRW